MAKNVNTLIKVTVVGNKELIQLRQNIELYSKNLKDLKKENKDVKNINKETAQSFAENEAKLKAARAEYKKAQSDLKNMSKATKTAGSFTMKMAKAFGVAQLAVDGFKKVTGVLSNQIKDAVGTFKSFEFEMAKVKSISGATDEEFAKLRSSAEALGRSTFFTATQVAELQINFSKLGFTATETLQAQEAALLTATATGEDLARTATVIGSTLRGFGLPATEAARAADVMAASFTSSALTLEKYQTSMTKVAPIATLLGFSMEETTAIMGSLTDAGIEASIAGTSLRNIFLKLGDPSSDLAKNLGRTVNSGDELVKVLKDMKDDGIDVEKALANVEKRQVTAFATMVRFAEKIGEQSEAFRNSRGAAQEMADIIGDTLEGATLRFQSALDGLKIALVGETGLGGALKGTLDRFAAFLNRLAESNTFVSGFKSSVLFLINGLKVLLTTIAATTLATKAHALAKALAATKTDLFAASTKFLNRQLRIMNVLIKRNPIGVVVGLITAAASSLVFFRDRTEESAEAQRKMNEQLKIEQELLQSKVYDDFLKKIQDEIGLSRTVFEDGIIKDGIITDQEVLERFKKDLESFNESELIQFGRFFKDEIVALQREAEQHPEGLLKDVILGKEEHFREMLGLTTSELIKIAEMRDSLSGNVESTIITNGDDDGDKDDPVKEELERKEFELQESLLAIKQMFADAEIDTRDTLNKTILDMQLIHLQDMLDTENLSAEQRLDIEKRIADVRGKIRDEQIQKKKEADEAEIESEKRKQKAIEDNIATMKETGQLLMQIGEQEGENSKIRALGIKITQAAAIAEGIHGLSKSFSAIAEQGLGGDPFSAFARVAAMSAMLASVISNLRALTGGGGQTSVVGSESGEMQFEKGGLTRGGMFQGASHANGGVKFRVGGTIHEAEGGEAIINKRSTARFRPILSAINSYNGNGVKFADGGIISQGEKYAMGGELRSVQSMVSGSTTQKVVLVESDVTNTQNRISALESQSSF